jgi:hypothetical protein
MESAAAPRQSAPLKLIAAALVGAAVAVSLGVYGHQHQPSYKGILGNGLFFSGTLNMKVWFATAAATFALFQLYTALRMYGRFPLPRTMPSWFPTAHRLSGGFAFVISLPVAYQCLWSLGFHVDNVSTRVAAHSLLGCFFYGAFAAKMLLLRFRNVPGAAVPIAGGLVFSTLIAIWLTSALWFFQNVGFPQF